MVTLHQGADIQPMGSLLKEMITHYRINLLSIESRIDEQVGDQEGLNDFQV